MPPERFARILDRFLPEDIRIVRSLETGPSFNPRHTGAVKTYEYRVLNSGTPDPILSRYTYRYSYELDIGAMNAAAAFLLGEHDFTSFANPAAQVKSYVRRVTQCGIDTHGSMVTITVRGNGFLYNMVRIIAGTLLEVGRGLRRPDEIQGILDASDRRAAGFTAPPQGLFLMGYELNEDMIGVRNVKTC